MRTSKFEQLLCTDCLAIFDKEGEIMDNEMCPDCWAKYELLRPGAKEELHGLGVSTK